MAPEEVAREAIDALGKGPRAIAGRANRVAQFFMQRLMSQRGRVEMMGRAMRKMYGRAP
jgi:hypothetical protein